MKNNYLVQAWLVLMLAVAFGAALAGVQIGLQPVIDANKRNETYGQIPSLVRVVEDGVEKVAVKELTEEPTVGGRTVLKAFWRPAVAPGEPPAKGEHIGWVIRADGQGFADKIELLVGLSADAQEILGLYVLDQKETPGLGNKVQEQSWRDQFRGKWATGGITVTKEKPQGNAVQAVTGATVSSQAVTDIVNKAVVDFRKALAAEGR